jgi:hypothetical protein
MFSLHPSSRAASLLVSYESATGGGGVDLFSLTPQSPGSLFDSENAPVTSLTVANHTAYWVADHQIYSDSLSDVTGGGNKGLLPSVPFGGVTVDDITVDPASNSYLVAWTAPGYGWFIAQYPLSPAGNFNVFVNATTVLKGLTIAGDKAYWIEGTNVWSQNLDGTGKALVQSFTLGGVSLNDLAVDTASQTYLLAAATSGLPPLIARYPLTPNASGTLFAFANEDIAALTVAGGRAYWLEGSSVWSENLNGTDLTLQATLPAGLTPTDLAVSLDAPAAVPEPAYDVAIAGVLILFGLVGRKRLPPGRDTAV